MNTPNPPTPISDETRRRSQLVLRTLPILLIPFVVGAVTLLLFQSTGNIPPFARPSTEPSPLVPIVIVAVFFSAIVMLVRIGRARTSVYLLIAGWTLVTTLFALRFGVTSIWPAMLILPICAAGLLIDSAASVSLAGVATVLVISLGWLETVDPTFRLRDMPPFENQPLASAGFWIGVFWSIAALTFLLANGLQRALKQSNLHAAELSKLSAELEQRVQTQTAALLEQEREAAMLEERARVAREIHDTIAQGLTGIIVQLGAAQRAMAATSPDAPQHLELAQKMAREALAEARRSIWNLRSPTLEHATLSDALQGVVTRQTNTNIAMTFETRGEVWQLPPAEESALLRVCQEALVNVTKHSNATRAQVMLEYAPTFARLSVSDDGVGFDEEILQSLDSVTSGFGLLGMRERIGVLGGTLELRSEGGARVVATIPRREVAQ